MKVRVLHVINDLSLGGAETLLTKWLPILKQDNELEVEVIVFLKNIGTETNITELQSANITIHTLDLDSLYTPKALLKLVAFFNNTAPYDVVHVHLFPAFYWLALAKLFIKKKKPKFVFTEHSTYNRRINNRKYYLIEKFIYNKYDHVIAISDAVYQKIINWVVTPSKVRLIKNGISINPFPSSVEALPITSQPNDKTILMVARFVPSKDHIGLLDALKLLKERGEISFHLYLAGEGVTKTDVMQLVDKYDLTKNVTFLGYVPNARGIMSCVDLNVLCSDFEGFSGVTIESVLARKPFVGSSVNGIKEIINDNNSLYEHGNKHDLCNKINALLTDPDMAAKSVNDNYEHGLQFDINVMVNKHAELYKTNHD